MKRNTILKSICTFLLLSTFFFFQACETDIQGEVESQVDQSRQVDPVLLEILKNPPSFTNSLGESQLTSRTDEFSLSEELQEQLLREFVAQFQNDEMLEYFLNNKGVPVFSTGYVVGWNGKKNMTAVPVVLEGIYVGVVHFIYNENEELSFVDYISLEHTQNLLLTKLEFIGSNRQKYLRVTAHAQYVTSLIVGQPMGDQYFDALEVLNSKIESTTELTSRTEECDGELLTISIYTGSLAVIANPDGSVTLPGADCSLCTALDGMSTEVICVQTGGNQNGGGTGTTYGTTDGPQIPIGILGSPYGPGGGESDPNGGGCTDENPSGSNTNPGGHMGGDGPGGEGGAEDPGIVEARLEEAIQRMEALGQIFDAEGANLSCLMYNEQLYDIFVEAVETYSGHVNCTGLSAEDQLRDIINANCYMGGCSAALRESIGQWMDGEEWIDVASIHNLAQEISSATGQPLALDLAAFPNFVTAVTNFLTEYPRTLCDGSRNLNLIFDLALPGLSDSKVENGSATAAYRGWAVENCGGDYDDIGRLNQMTGAIFEEAVLSNIGSRPNTTSVFPTTERSYGVKPDAIEPWVVHVGGMGIRRSHVYHGLIWKEVKAYASPIRLSTSNYQIRGMIQALSQVASNSYWPGPPFPRPKGALEIITPEGTTIDPAVRVYAQAQGIGLFHREVSLYDYFGTTFIMSSITASELAYHPGGPILLFPPSLTGLSCPGELNENHPDQEIWNE